MISKDMPSTSTLTSIAKESIIKAIPSIFKPKSVDKPVPTETAKTVDGRDFDATDLRVRIALPPLAGNIFYLDGTNSIMFPLQKTSGFIFPLQPTINISHNAEYQSTKPTHSNFPYYHWVSSEIAPISLQSEFPVRTADDARYVMAGIHFLRSLTKGFNAKDTNYAGAPPMVARLYGLGFSGFDNLPVVIASVGVNYPDNVDYITFKTDAGLARMPSVVSITLSLNPVFSRDFITNFYTTMKYSRGEVRLFGSNEFMQNALLLPIKARKSILPEFSTGTTTQSDPEWSNGFYDSGSSSNNINVAVPLNTENAYVVEDLTSQNNASSGATTTAIANANISTGNGEYYRDPDTGLLRKYQY